MIWYYILSVYLTGVMICLGVYVKDVVKYHRHPEHIYKFIPTSSFYIKLTIVMALSWPILTVAGMIIRFTRK